MASAKKDTPEATFRRFFITRSAAFRALLRTAGKVLANDANLLILGESGVGKDFLATAIHAAGHRRSGAFVRIDCAAIPPDLFESELFGFERGAFTDARQPKVGKIEAAQHGTLYLDGITSLTPALQAKLLRVIQEKRFSRLGGTRTIDIDVRIIASANGRFDSLVSAGAMREDLFYRLNVVSLEIPPLRDRREDIPLLAKAFLREFSKRHKKPIRAISDEALAELTRYSWPGNIRELRNSLERAVIVETEELLQPESLPLFGALTSTILGQALEERLTLDELEKRYISAVLKLTDSNFSKAADMLGINRKTLLEKRRKYEL